MKTLYELELEMMQRAEQARRRTVYRPYSDEPSPTATVRRAPTLWLAGKLRAMADRLEARAVRTA